MAINPIALSIRTPDTVGAAFQGFEFGRQIKGQNALAADGYAASNGDQNALARLYQSNPGAAAGLQADYRVKERADDAKRLEGLQTLSRMGRDIIRITDPRQRDAAVQQAKVSAARMYGIDPSTLGWVNGDTIDDLVANVETEADRIMQGLQLRTAQVGLQGAEMGLKRDQAQMDYYSNGGAFGAPSAAPAGGDYFSRLGGQESGGDLNARNPNSTATGRYQFIEGTWRGLVNSPEGRAAGLTMDGRGDARQEQAAIQLFTQQNAQRLQAAGIPVTEKTAYLAHFLGPDGAIKALQSDPNASAADMFPDAARANPTVFYDNGRARSLAELVDFQTRKFPNAPLGMANAPAPATPQPIGMGAGVGAQQPNAAPPMLQANPAPAVPAPVQQPQAQPQQSIAEMVQSDPTFRDLYSRAQRAASIGATGDVQMLNSLMDARVKELQAGMTPANTTPNFDNENSFRTQYRQIAQPLADAVASYGTMQSLANDNTGASDVALVFSFFKTIDPTSTVREGEYATASNAAGVPDQIRAMYNGILNGQKLVPQQRTELVSAAGRYAETARTRLEQVNKQYGDMAPQYGMDASRILLFPNQPAPAAPAGAPAPQAPNAAPVQIQSEAEWEALPPGTLYIAPDGQTKRKQ